jgi:acyl-CoA synthetase (NDP forming)
MSIRNLDHFFTPDSVALIGACARTGSVGRILDPRDPRGAP